MKILLTLFVLLFSSSVLAEDISDFQIEGMSVGDSLLDYFSEEEIKNNVRNIYVNKKFTLVSFYEFSFFKTYDNLDIHYLTENNFYKIYSIAGNIFYSDNISECYKQMNKIDNELQTLTYNAKILSDQTYNHPDDPTGKSIVKSIVYMLDSGVIIGMQCYDFSDEYFLNHGVEDNLEVFVDTKELNSWLSSNPYQG